MFNIVCKITLPIIILTMYCRKDNSFLYIIIFKLSIKFSYAIGMENSFSYSNFILANKMKNH
jgi:hypothetical protein